MRQVTVSVVGTEETKEIDIRGMTRPEIRSMKKFGVGSMKFDVKLDQFDDVMDTILEMQIPQEILDDVPNRDLILLYDAVIAETYGSRDEEKNSSPSGLSVQTENGMSIADTAANDNDKSE